MMPASTFTFYSAFLASAILASPWWAGCQADNTGARARSAGPTGADAPASRIVSTMPSTTEMLLAFEVGHHVVAISRFCAGPTEVQTLPRIGSGLDPDLEVMLALQPDLVVGTVAQKDLPFLRSLEALGIGTFLVDDRRLDSLFADMLRLGERVGAREASEREVSRIRGVLAELADMAANRPRPRVLLLFHCQPLYAAGPDTFVEDLIRAAGGDNVLTAGAWVQLDGEQLINLAPDVILAAREVDEHSLDSELASYGTVPAVANRRVHRLSSPGLSQPGPGIAEAAVEIARYLHQGSSIEVTP